MKVLVGQFKTESNANVNLKNDISRYDIAFGDDCLRKCKVMDVFQEEGIEMIPAIYADTGPSYVIKKNTFDYIEQCMLEAVKNNIDKIDGIYLMLHGASYVEEIGSGDFHMLKEIRKIVGPYLPIFIACDPHGNLSKEYVENVTLIRSFRESPHTDSDDTKKKVARLLCEFLRNRQNIRPIYKKLPLILGGEQSVSTDEPVKSINKLLDEIELDDRVMSVSWHVGYLRHDCAEAGCGIVIVPSNNESINYCREKLDELAGFIMERRHEFHYTGLTMQPKEAIFKAISFEGKPVFITDSGDNTGSGAMGANTSVLIDALKSDRKGKKFLFANINDLKTFSLLNQMEIGDEADIELGVNVDANTAKVPLKVKIKNKGPLMGTFLHDRTKVYGHSVLVKIVGENIDVNIANNNWGMVEENQFIKANIDWDEYDVIVVKIGYIFPELEKKGKLSIMALTYGATLQDTKKIDFKLIQRPMYPLDNI